MPRSRDPLPRVSPVNRSALIAHPLPVVHEEADKESRGHILVVAGSEEMPGAATLCALAALRVGAGKLSVATSERAAPVVRATVLEGRVIGLAQQSSGKLSPSSMKALQTTADCADAVVLGPGMTSEAEALQLASAIFEVTGTRTPVLLDAAALCAVSIKRSKRALITPHAGEMAHLSGVSKDSVCADAVDIAADAMMRWDVDVALKGCTTIVAARDRTLWAHRSTDPGLGTSGSGDVLSGAIGGLLARGADPLPALLWGIALHSRAGAALSRKVGSLGFLAGELAAEMPRILESMSATRPARKHAQSP